MADKQMNGHKQLTILEEVINGFRQTPKQIHGKFRYDTTGDLLFQQIMREPEYYITNCEAEILRTQTKELVEALQDGSSTIDLIDLGAGDATKTAYLLQYLVNQGIDFTYYPVDISSAIIADLETNLPKTFPGLKIKGLQGDYFEMLDEITRMSTNPKTVIFLGGNLGCFTEKECSEFLQDLGRCLKPKDKILVGFDLVKNPHQINAAYNTPVSVQFNLHYLDRFNKELGADFDKDQYEHYSSFGPSDNTQRNFIMSRKDQVVTIGGEEFKLAKHEFIHTSVSRKFTEEGSEKLAATAGLKPTKYFYDSQRWFFDVIWEKI